MIERDSIPYGVLLALRIEIKVANCRIHTKRVFRCRGRHSESLDEQEVSGYEVAVNKIKDGSSIVLQDKCRDGVHDCKSVLGKDCGWCNGHGKTSSAL